jgi:hypothetical protein
MKVITFHYKFKMSDGRLKEFLVQLDGETLSLIPKQRDSYPEWTRLSDHQCPNCPLKESEHPRCPIAANLTDVVEVFKDSISHEEAEIEIETESRTYSKRTSLQNGISSLIGIYMVTSGCPVMDKLKPMVRTHLPFATAEETMYRAVTMYLLAQYFLWKSGKNPDWEMSELVKIYEEVRVVNKSFCKRLLETRIQDSTLNAIVHLDCFADMTSFSLQEEKLNQIQRLFGAYIASSKK